MNQSATNSPASYEALYARLNQLNDNWDQGDDLDKTNRWLAMQRGLLEARGLFATQAAQIEGLRAQLAALADMADESVGDVEEVAPVRSERLGAAVAASRALLSNLPAAPAPSNLLQRAYTVLADIRHDWPGRVSVEGQSLLCAMREEVAKQTGSTGEEVSTGVKCDFVRAALSGNDDPDSDPMKPRDMAAMLNRAAAVIEDLDSETPTEREALVIDLQAEADKLNA